MSVYEDEGVLIKKQTVSISITLPTYMVVNIDTARKDTSRSAFIRRYLKAFEDRD